MMGDPEGYVTPWRTYIGPSAFMATTGGDMSSTRWKIEPMAVANFVRSIVPEPNTICDLGCGTGRIYNELKKHYKMKATDKFPNIPTAGGIEIFPYGMPFNAYGVISSYVMQHIPEALFPAHLEILEDSTWTWLFLVESLTPTDHLPWTFWETFLPWAEEKCWLMHEHLSPHVSGATIRAYLRK
jgi:hypothetical protein